MPSKRWQDAVHEAGHAVSWMSIKGNIAFCKLSSQGNSETELIADPPPEMVGKMREYWLDLRNIALAGPDEWDSLPISKLHGKAHASLRPWISVWLDFLLSGNSAEHWFIGTADTGREGPTDLGKRDCLLNVAEQLLAAKQVAAWSSADYLALQSQRQLPVLRLATALYEHGYLDGDQCRAAAGMA
jgi:hypothetical protein